MNRFSKTIKKYLATLSMQKRAGKNASRPVIWLAAMAVEVIFVVPSAFSTRGIFAGHERRGSVSLTSSRHTSHGPAVQYQIINSQINGAIAAVTAKSYGV